MSKLLILIGAWAKNGSFARSGFERWLVRLANVPFACWLKIVLKKCGWEKNKKQRVGNECRLTRCPFLIWSVCRCPPVKICFSFFCFHSVNVCCVVSFYACCQRFANWRSSGFETLTSLPAGSKFNKKKIIKALARYCLQLAVIH